MPGAIAYLLGDVSRTQRTEITRISLEGDESPAAAVFRYYRTRPRQPWHENNQGKTCLVPFPTPLATVWLKEQGSSI